MKRILMPVLLSAVLIGCSDNKYEGPKNSLAYDVNTASVFIPLDDKLQPQFIAQTEYRFTQFFSDASWEVSAKSVALPGKTHFGFTSPNIMGSFNANGIRLNYVPSFTGTSDAVISNLNCLCTDNYYEYVSASDTEYKPTTHSLGQFLFMTYDVDGVGEIHTFPAFAFYSGQTLTKYQYKGDSKQFTTDKALYQIYMNIAEKKASLIIYNVKFAEEMPMSLPRVAVTGLDIIPDRECGYIISGKNLEPEVGFGLSAVQYDNYTFESIQIKPINDRFSKMSINYKVEGGYNGSFTGSCLRNEN